MADHIILGVTGGIASGKSTVSAMLAAMGAPLIDFDVLARQVVEPGQPALEAIQRYFGNQVLNPDGTLNRKHLSDIIFNDPAKRKKLESFTHAAIFEAYRSQVAQLTAAGTVKVIQAGVPLLFELNLKALFDRVLVVYIPPDEQVRRLAARDNISLGAAANILKSQWPIDQKADAADDVIDNSGSRAKTRYQVEAFWKKIRKTLAD